MSLFKKLLGTTALAAAAAPAIEGAPKPAASGEAPAEGPGETGLTEARIETALQAARDEGIAAERDRTAAVFASDEGKGNMTMAAWMLASNPTATAESIVAQLKTCPVQASAAPAAPAAEAAPLTTSLAATPVAELTGEKPAATANAGADAPADNDAMWDGIQAAGREAMFGASSAVPAVAQGGQAAYRPRTGH